MHLPAGGATVRFMPGPDGPRFEAAALERFTDGRFTVGSDSNRMGYRLEGPAIRLADTAPVLSSATPPGTIQVPPSGQPILLMADRQTTGGYAVLGTVVTADLGVAGQLAPGDWIAFEPCDHRLAIAALIEMEQRLMRFAPVLHPGHGPGRRVEPRSPPAGESGGFVTHLSMDARIPDPPPRVQPAAPGVRLAAAFGDRVRPGAPLAELTTFRAGGAADWLVERAGVSDLATAVRIANSFGMPLTVLGGGSNVLVADRGVRGLVVRLRTGRSPGPVPTPCARTAASPSTTWCAGRFDAGCPASSGGRALPAR